MVNIFLSVNFNICFGYSKEWTHWDDSFFGGGGVDMHGSRKFCQRRSNYDKVFFVFVFCEGREDPNSTKSKTPFGRLEFEPWPITYKVSN